jgi:hypothetical protein
MKKKYVFGFLQGLFTVGAGMSTVGFFAVTGFGIATKVIDWKKLASQANLNMESLEGMKAASSPFALLSILMVLAVVIGIFRLSGELFKKLKQNEIFVVENVVKLKHLAVLVGSLSLVSSLPSLLMSHSLMGDGYMFDLSYLIIALLLLSFAKVWERANEMAQSVVE